MMTDPTTTVIREKSLRVSTENEIINWVLLQGRVG